MGVRNPALAGPSARRIGNVRLRAPGPGRQVVRARHRHPRLPPPVMGERDGAAPGTRWLAPGSPRGSLELPGNSSPIRWGARTSMPKYWPTARGTCTHETHRQSVPIPIVGVATAAAARREDTESKSTASWAIDCWNSPQRIMFSLAARGCPQRNPGRHGESRRVRPRGSLILE